MNKRDTFLSKCDEVVSFCFQHTPYVFGAWSRETALIYVAFHAMTGGLFIRRENGHVAAVGFCWPAIEEEVKRKFNGDGYAFDWRLPKNSDCLIVGEVIADKATCAMFLEKAKRQWPTLRKCFTFRRRPTLRMVEICPERLRRYYGRWEKRRDN